MNIDTAFHLNYLKSIRLNRKLKIRVFPKVHVKKMSHGKIIVDGKLSLGRTWKGLGFFQSQIKVENDAILKVIGDFSIYSGLFVTVNEGARLILGSGYINYNCNLECSDKIVIGNNVSISENVTIRDTDNHYLSYSGYVKDKPIFIKDNVWIGMNATILKGVTVGEGSVVAAGSIVTRNVPDHCVVAGVPAKVIRKDIQWGNKPFNN